MFRTVGGSLITSRHVLSAAHCISQNLIAVRLGEYDIRTTDDGPHETIRIRGARIHDDFDLVLGTNDIAIIYLARDVEFNGNFLKLFLYIFRFFFLNLFLVSTWIGLMKYNLFCIFYD